MDLQKTIERVWDEIHDVPKGYKIEGTLRKVNVSEIPQQGVDPQALLCVGDTLRV